MLCNECNQHQATVSINQIIGDKKKRRYLCEFCAKSVTFTPSPRVLSGEMWEYMRPDDPLLEIVAHDERYAIGAYHFILEACFKLWEKERAPGDFTPASTSAGRLLEALRRHALSAFGSEAKSVLNSWGVIACKDFGEIVFNLIGTGQLTAEPGDTKDNFQGGYDFDTAFPGHAR
jgi:uncharacterized repeat protein (TIGR04138 family)